MSTVKSPMQSNSQNANARFKQTLPEIKVKELAAELITRFDLKLTKHIHALKKSFESANDQYIFEQCWALLLKDNISKYLFNYFPNPFQLNYKQLMLLFLVKKMHQLGHYYSPLINVLDQDCLSDIKELKGGALILSVHNGFAFNGRIMTDLGRQVSTITSDPNILSNFRRSGITHPINMIKNDIYCLAQLRQSIQNGDIVCCNVDYRGPNGIYTAISAVLFESADRFKIPMYFTKSNVLLDGSVSVNLKPYIEKSMKDKKYIDDFINFINSSPEVYRFLSEGTYNRN